MQTLAKPTSSRSSAKARPDAGATRNRIHAYRVPLAPKGQPLPVDKDTGAVEDATDLFGIRSKWMDVTPEMARDWLQNNFRNRPVSGPTVIAYALDMKNKRWVPTHQGIAFNTRDELIDGQHRLYAIIKSGCTVRMMVTFGLPSKIKGLDMTVMDCVDRGRTRTVADQLKIQHGLQDGAVIAAICGNIGSLCHGQKTKRLSVDQTLAIYRAFEEPMNAVVNSRSRAHGLKMIGVLAGFTFAAAAGNFDTVLGLYKLLNDGDIPEKQSAMPLIRLREFLVSPDAVLLSRGTDRALIELVLKVLWQQVTGQHDGDLSPSSEGAEYFKALQAERVATVAKIFELPER